MSRLLGRELCHSTNFLRKYRHLCAQIFPSRELCHLPIGLQQVHCQSNIHMPFVSGKGAPTAATVTLVIAFVSSTVWPDLLEHAKCTKRNTYKLGFSGLCAMAMSMRPEPLTSVSGSVRIPHSLNLSMTNQHSNYQLQSWEDANISKGF